MTRTSLKDMNCSWAQAADVLGDKWSILILRDAFFGANTFSAFEKSSGVAKSVLSKRLNNLVDDGILSKQSIGLGTSRSEYELTDKGRALLPVMLALGQWSDEWIMKPNKAPWLVVDKKNQNPLQKLKAKSSNNREVNLDEITFIAGPGASKKIRDTAKQIENTQR